MFARMSVLFLGALISLPAVAASMNGNWKGKGAVEIANKTMQSNNVAYAFEQTAASISLKSCAYTFADGSFLQCSPFTLEIRNGAELWSNGQMVGSITPTRMNANLDANGFRIAVAASFTETGMNYSYQSVSAGGQGMVMSANLSR